MLKFLVKIYLLLAFKLFDCLYGRIASLSVLHTYFPLTKTPFELVAE